MFKIIFLLKYLFSEEEEAKNSKDKKQEAVLGKSWRDLIPVIKMEVSSVSWFCYNY